jgi:hypothetical protein
MVYYIHKIFAEVLDMTLEEIIGNIGIHNIEITDDGKMKIAATSWAKRHWEEIKLFKSEIINAVQNWNAEQEAKKAAEEVHQAEELKALKAGEKEIVLHYHDGEYLSGYQVHGQEASLLKELGLAEWVDGWGYYVKSDVVNALGEEFTYPQAVEYSRPARDAKAAKTAQAEATRQAKFDEAKSTGEPVELERYLAPCNDPHEECDMDIVVVYAMPDGTTKTNRNHTW